jgi:hypothetical protein
MSENKTEMLSPEEHRYCVGCKHWVFDPGHPGYSEYTPGYGWSSECEKGHWTISGSSCDERDFEKVMRAAATCNDYEERESG